MPGSSPISCIYMALSDSQIVERVRAGDHRVLSRVLTWCENRDVRVREVQIELYKSGGKSHVIGFTGPPGAGKSTLVDQIGHQLRKQGKKVAIIAVDPSSPFSGGAILGDRVRMNKSGDDSSIFIRSMATRGSLGGLARATIDCIQIMDAAGFDYILVETVGVGQAEVDIVTAANTCAVVLMTGMGDGVQAIKAGILEIADIFAVNKADREGADLLFKDLRMLVSLVEFEADAWRPEILKTIATKGEGAEELLKQVERHTAWLAQSELGRKRKLQAIENIITNIVSDELMHAAIQRQRALLDRLVLKCFVKECDPYSAARQLVETKG
ncbi:MAG: methylmalonyl Co-A mutase-associated GTPase MeaB [Proteobacteria bacterium]|nr:MAG: methylmalonyl Co-A mutase-associated GTPase MeaB [Pseudomonadota bacterium]